MKLNNIYSGDCIKVLNETIKKNSIDLVFADPPYNLSGNALKWQGNKTGGDWFMVNEKWDKMSDPDYFAFTEQWIKACHKVLKDNGSIYVCGSFHNIGEILVVLKKVGFSVKNFIANNSVSQQTIEETTTNKSKLLYLLYPTRLLERAWNLVL